MAKTRYAMRIKWGGAGDYDPQAIGEEFEQLIADHKEHVTEDEIIARARKQDSTMRPFFTWDQEAAALKQNKNEARRLARMLVKADKDGKPTRTRAMVIVHHPEHGGKRVYLTHDSAMTRPEMREELNDRGVHSLMRSLVNWGANYGSNPELRQLAKEAEALKKKMEKVLKALA